MTELTNIIPPKVATVKPFPFRNAKGNMDSEDTEPAACRRNRSEGTLRPARHFVSAGHSQPTRPKTTGQALAALATGPGRAGLMQTPDIYAGADRARGKFVFPLAAARRFPIYDPRRLAVLDYRLTPALPNGSPSRCHSYAPFLLGGSFLLEAQITRGIGGAFWLELPMLAYDTAQGCRVAMHYPAPLLASICQAIEQKYLLATARAYSRREGRN